MAADTAAPEGHQVLEDEPEPGALGLLALLVGALLVGALPAKVAWRVVPPLDGLVLALPQAASSAVRMRAPTHRKRLDRNVVVLVCTKRRPRSCSSEPLRV
jgi:hypothetical protein